MTNKIQIAERILEGNLNELKQLYRINYMEPEQEYQDKIELALLMVKEDGTQGAYRSLRLTQPAQVLDLIAQLTIAYSMFLRKRGNLFQENYQYKLKHLLDKVGERFKDAMLQM